MPHPLTDRLDEVRRRLRRAGLVRGAALAVVAAVCGLSVAGAADSAVRSNEPVWRLLATAAAITPAAWVALTMLVPPLHEATTPVELARRLESRDPAWGGRLAAATAFLTTDDPRESDEIRRKIIDDATVRLVGNPPGDLADPSRVTRPLLWAAVSVAVGLVAVAVAPVAVITALSRLALPLADIEWPRAVDLILVAESGEPLPQSMRIGRGQTLRFTVRNVHGDVPEDLTLEYLTRRGGRRTEPVSTGEETTDGNEPRSVGLAALFAAEGPLRFRVVGGDDRDTPFVTAEVVPPPVFERIQVTVTPPSYLDLPPKKLAKGVGNVAGVVGSSVAIKARANKPLAAAVLRIGGGDGLAVEVEPNGGDLSATFPLTEAGLSTYGFLLRDAGGFENPEAARYELRVMADEAPRVTLTEPPEDLRATAEADLPVVVAATDDYGFTSVRVTYGVGSSPFEEASAATGEAPGAIPLFDAPPRPTKGDYPLVWSLGPLGLVPGDRVHFRGEAVDACDLGPPHLGFSSPRTVSIVSAVEKRDELLERQSKLLDGLLAARRDEGRLGEAVDSLLDRLAEAEELDPEDRDRLARAEAEQRRLSATLTEPARGLEAQTTRAAVELRANRIDDEPLAARLERIARELSSLRDDALPAAERELTAARKAETPRDAEAALASSRSHMNVVTDGLDSLLEELGAWRNRRDLGGEVADLLGVQSELAEATERAAAETLGAAAGELTDRQAENLARLGQRQAGLADRLTRVGETIDGQATGTDPDAEQTEAGATDDGLREAADLIREAGLPAAAQAAGDSIRANELGDAGRRQGEVLAGLRRLEELLSRAEATSPGTEELRKAATELAELAAAEREIAETLKKAAESEGLSESDREALSRRQSELREQTVEAARGLRDAGVSEAAVREAGRRMADSLERLARREDGDAGRDAEAAAERLEQAQRDAEETAERAEEQLAREQLESSAAAISALAERQQAVNAEVTRLDGLKVEAGRLSRSQLRTLRQTAEAQRALLEETADFAVRLEAAAAVSLALRSAADRMDLAAVLLNANETGDEPRRHGLAAKETLDRVAAALQLAKSGGRSGGEQDAGENEAGPPGEAIPLLAQLELLKGLQEDLLRRTEEVDRRLEAGQPTATQDDELRRMAEEQAGLAELFVRLVQANQDEEVPEP